MTRPKVIYVEDFPTDLTLEVLRSIVDWQERSVTVYGKTYPQPRLTAWYAPVPYVYSGLRWDARPLPTRLEALRKLVEEKTGHPFNSVLCNRYRDGSDTVGWHADDEPLFGKNPIVASLSFGATRTFKLKPRTPGPEPIAYDLTDRSLLVMGEGVQEAWLHALPRTKKPVGERINLTFRYAREVPLLQRSTRPLPSLTR